MQYNVPPPQMVGRGQSYNQQNGGGAWGPGADLDINGDALASSFAGMGFGGPEYGQGQRQGNNGGQGYLPPFAARGGDNGGEGLRVNGGAGFQRDMGSQAGQRPMSMGHGEAASIDFLGPLSGDFSNGAKPPARYAGAPSHSFNPSADDGYGAPQYAQPGFRNLGNRQPNPSAPPFITSYGNNQLSPPAQITMPFSGKGQPANTPLSPQDPRGSAGSRPVSMVELGGMGMNGGGMGGGAGLDGNFGGWLDGGAASSGLSPSMAQQMNNFTATNMPGPPPRHSALNSKRGSESFRSPTSAFSPSTARSMASPSAYTPSGPSFPPTPNDSAQQQLQHIMNQPPYMHSQHNYRTENTPAEIAYGLSSNGPNIISRHGDLAQLPSSNSLSSLGSGHSISSLAAGRMIGGLLDDEVIPTAIVIKNIPFAVQKETLLAIMESLGAPLPYAFNYHLDGSTFRGLAFANFRHPHEAEAVVVALNGYDISGRKLRVEYKKVLQAGEKERIERDKAVKRMKSLNFDKDGNVSSAGGRERNLGADRRRRPQQDDDRSGPRLANHGGYQNSPGGGRSVSSRWGGEGGDRTRHSGSKGSIPPVPPLPLLPPLPLASLQGLQNLQMGIPTAQILADLAAYAGSPNFNPLASPGSNLLSPHLQSNGPSPLLQMPLENLPYPMSFGNSNQASNPLSPPVNISAGQARDAYMRSDNQDLQRGPSPSRSLTPGSVSESNDPTFQAHRRVSAAPSSHSSLSNGVSSSTPLDLNDPRVLDIYSRILLFKEDRMRDELAFSRTLSIRERRLVHLVAQKLGMHHFSAGEGNERYAVVTRMAPGGHQQRPSRTEQNLATFSSSLSYPYGDNESDSAPSPHLRIKKSMPNMNYLSGPSVTQTSSRLMPQRSSGNLRDYTTISNGLGGGAANGTIKRNGAGETGSASQMFNNLFGTSLTSPVTATGGGGFNGHSGSYGSNGLLSPLDANGFSHQQYQQGSAQSSPVESSTPASPAGGVPVLGVVRQPRGPSGDTRGFSQRASLRPAPLQQSAFGEPGNGIGGIVSGSSSGSGGGFRGRSDAGSLKTSGTSGSSTIEEGDEEGDDESGGRST